MEEENKEEGQTTTTTTTPATKPATDTSKSKMDTKAGENVDYQSGAVETGQRGAENLKKVTVPKYNPITLKMMNKDPELKGAMPSLIGNAVFKGLEGALSTKASGRDFDPTTRMSEYNDAEMARYKENATDKENAIYQAQKQPIENAVSAEAQAGIQKEDAALNAYIQDYTAEKDQDRKFALLQQVMGQAGLVQKDDNGNVLTDENGNPVFKAWEDLETTDLLKLNQLMQYLSGDTSVMNLLVGQYGPDIVEKLEGVFQEFKDAGGFGNWLKNLITGQSPTTPSPTENPVSLTPKYTADQIKEGLELNNADIVSYVSERGVVLPDGSVYDISDTSQDTLQKLAEYIAQGRLDGTIGQNTYNNILKSIETKTKKANGNKIGDKSGKNAADLVGKMVENRYNQLYSQKAEQTQNDFTEGSDTTGLNVSEYGDIDNMLKTLLNDAKGTSTTVDTNALKTMVGNSTMADEVKKDYLEQIEKAEKDIALNLAEEEANANVKLTQEDAKKRAKGLNKTLNQTIYEKGKTKYNAKKENYNGSYSEAVSEAQKIYETLKRTGEQMLVINNTEPGQTLLGIAKLATGNGQFAEEDKKKGGFLANYITLLSDPNQWGE